MKQNVFAFCILLIVLISCRPSPQPIAVVPSFTPTPVSTDTPMPQSPEWMLYNTDNSGLPSNLLTPALTFDTKGNLWIGTWDGGLAKFDGGNWMVYNTDNSGLPHDEVVSLACDARGNLWIGTGDGLAKYNGKSWTVYKTDNSGLPHNAVHALAFDAQGKFGNPYGRSLLRRVYKYYIVKDAVLKMMSVALDRKGTPLTVVYADPNTTLFDGKNFDPNVPANQRKTIRADQAAKAAFENVHNDTTVILPGKKGQIFDLDFVSQDSNTQSFIDTLNFCNKSILRGLLIPPLVFNDGDGTGSYALGSAHTDTFHKILDGMNEGVKQTLIDQVIKELINYNFPESAWKKDGLGEFSRREFSNEEKEQEMNMFEKAVHLGVIDSTDLNDLNKMRETLGFQPLKKVPEQVHESLDNENDEQGEGNDFEEEEIE